MTKYLIYSRNYVQIGYSAGSNKGVNNNINQKKNIERKTVWKK